MATLVRESEDCRAIDLSRVEREPTDEDRRVYWQLVSTDLTDEQIERVVTPPRVFRRQKSMLALHWHPEFIPLDLVRRRIDATFPDRELELIIPTQHNQLMSYGPYTGVEVDCYSPGFHSKVQLLFHFANQKLSGRGEVFKAMVAHTHDYRSRQLFEFIESVLDDRYGQRVEEAAGRTGADQTLVEFVRIHVRRLKKLIDQHESRTPPIMLKNKLIRNYFDTLADHYPERLVHHAQVFLRAVKMIVKRNFSLDYFYRTREVIEEGRNLGACIVIPHPEQFWPILLDDLDVDGIEVWNPQSFQYTEFLIDVVNRENHTARRGQRPVLVTMGDDCHLGEKVRPPERQDEEKAGREIGVQPPWDDLTIRKRLILANASRSRIIREYTARLDG